MRHIRFHINEGKTNVSIHASVKDATKEDTQVYDYLFVSIHASVKDATPLKRVLLLARFVSIHASVKDAT